MISDISGQDIESHNNNPKILVQKIRNWFSANTVNTIPGPGEIWNVYNQFSADLLKNLSSTYSASDIDEMPIGDFIKFGKDWIRNFKTK